MKKAVLLFFTASISTVVLIFFVYFSFNDGKLHLVICDVDQGDAIFIRTPNGADILVDGGPNDKVLSCLSRHMPFWDRTLEVVILTHPDADHLAGIVYVIDRYRLSNLFTQSNSGHTQLYKLYAHDLAEKKLSAKYMSSGDKLVFKDGTSLNIFWPPSKKPDPVAQNNTNTSLNQFAVVSLLKYGKFTALLTADAGVEIQDQIASEIGDIDVLKVPHHGSKTGMSDYYLSSITPELAVISVGAKNSYNHPNPISLDLLKKHKIKVLRTDLNGEIEIVSDGSTYSVKSK